MRSPTILITEDDPLIRNLLVTVLSRENYTVLEADSAEEAVNLSNRFEGIIDLLIADFGLKMMTGRQAAEKISQSRPGLKVLHTSGHPLEKLEELEGIPRAEFLAKPYLPKDLIATIKEILK